MEENENLNVNNNNGNMGDTNGVSPQQQNYNNTNNNKKGNSKVIIIVIAVIIGLIVIAAIPVTLIIGGITASLVAGDNGIFEKAREARETSYQEAKDIEDAKLDIQIAALDVEVEYYDYLQGKKIGNLTVSLAISEINDQLDDDGSEYSLSTDGTVLKNGSKLKDSDGKTLKANIEIDNSNNSITVTFE